MSQHLGHRSLPALAQNWNRLTEFLRDAFRADPQEDALEKTGIWFWAAMATGAIIRVYLVLFTQGTYDVVIWGEHASRIQEIGLMEYYRANPLANHPPFISVLEAVLQWYSQHLGIPYRVMLRAPFALLDVGILVLLLHLLRNHKRRFLAVVFYWLSPATMILSAYHGNTDNAVAFSIILSIWFIHKDRALIAGIAIGIGLWIKLPGILVIPVLFLALPGWRRRFIFVLAIGATASVTYLPALISDASILLRNVFGYRGQVLHTTNGTHIWGLADLVGRLCLAMGGWPEWLVKLVFPVVQRGQIIAYVFVLTFYLFRRSRHGTGEIAVSVTAIFCAIYAFSSEWAFQYLLWSMPFWFMLPSSFYVPTMSIVGAYIYSLYWCLCGNPWLLGSWDFIGNPVWPRFVLLSRDASIVLFFVSSCAFLIVFIRPATRRQHKAIE